MLFHKTFGYRNNTIRQFKDFLMCLLNNEIVMPISSQVLPVTADNNGSETTGLDIERIKKLHERLSEIERGIKL